jgi:hypothetical protein
VCLLLTLQTLYGANLDMATTYSSKPPSMPSAPSVGSRPSVSTTAPSTRPRARPTTATPVSQERGRGSVYSGLGSRPASQDNRDDDNKNKSFFERLRDTWRNSGGKDNDNLKDPRDPKPMSIAPRERDEDGSSVYTSDAFTVQPSSTRVKPLPALPEVAVEELEPDTESTQLAIRKATEQTLGIMQIQEYLDKIKKEQEKTELKTPDFVVETPKEETAKKGLMAKPYDPDRMREENEPLGIRNTVISALDKDITKNGTFSNTALENAIKETTNNSTFNASVLGSINKETGGSGPIDEKGYGNLTGAQAAKDKRIRGSSDPESVARRAAYEALDKNPEFINGDKETKDKMIFDIFYDDQYRKAGLKLGNTQAGDGSLFKGRGLIQITGRENYKKVQDKLAEKGIQVDLIASPELVNDSKYALPVALAFLEVKGITPDTVGELGPYKMTRIMNPGDVSGTEDRWSKVTDLLTGDALEKAQNSNEKTAQLKVGVKADGIIGNKSVAAFKKWLSDAGINFDSSYTPYDLVRLVNAN